MAAAFVKNHGTVADVASDASVTCGTTTSAIPAGNTAFVLAAFDDNPSTGTRTVSDPSGNTWVRDVGPIASGGSTCWVELWRCHVTTEISSSAAITMNKGGTFRRPTAFVLVECSGLDAAAPDTTGSASGTSTSQTIGSVTTTVADCLLIFAGGNQQSGGSDAAASISATDGDWTATSTVNADSGGIQTRVNGGYRVVTTATTYSGDANTLSSGYGWATAVAAYAPAGGGEIVEAVGQASETDAALAVGKAKSKAVGQATQTDTAQAVTRVKTRAVGQAEETETALPITALKTRAVGQASETDEAQAVTALKTVAVGIAEETDAALSITAATEGEIVQPVGQAEETDTALAVTAAKAKAVGQATETEAALPITARKTVSVGIVVETSTALGIVALKTRAVGQATDSASALALTAVKAYTLGIAAETETAQAIGRLKTRTLGIAEEIEVALELANSGAVYITARLGSSPSAGELAGATRAGRFDAPTPEEVV